MSAPLIDLSRLPPPDVVETLDYESIRAAMVADFSARWPAYTAALESDPVIKLIEVAAYRELLLRGRINDAARAGMLACAAGGDLDNLAARYATTRRAGESDEMLRERAQIGFHQVAAAGSLDRYRWHAFDAHPDVVQVDAWRMAHGQVGVSVLARETVPAVDVDETAQRIGQALFGPAPAGYAHLVASADSAALAAVRDRLYADDVRVLGVDLVMVEPDIHAYAVYALVIVPPGPDPTLVRTQALDRTWQRVRELARFRVDLHLTALQAALMPEGARNVLIHTPDADVARGPGELAVCTAVDVEMEVWRD